MTERDLYLTEKIKNVAFNLRYKFLAYFEQYEKTNFLKQGDQIHILGNSFQPHKNNLTEVSEKIYEIFLATPWFTYRSGFPSLAHGNQGSYVSDTGWGCMVRVGQMLFAQIIKEHRNTNKQNIDILNLFNDFNKNSPLSIQNIAKVALRMYNLKPGEWFNPSQISNVLSILYEKKCSETDQLRFLVFNSGNIFFDQVIAKMFGEKITLADVKKCKCKPKTTKFICAECFRSLNQFGVCLIVLSRIGIERPQPKYLQILQKFMMFKQFRGVIGGKPKKALYFLGRHNDDYIYLDPHYVQNAKKQIQTISDSYFCESFRKCKNSAIDSSLGICFYLKNLESLNNFYSSIERLKKEDSDNMFIFTSDVTPSYMRMEGNEDFQEDQDDEEFQKL